MADSNSNYMQAAAEKAINDLQRQVDAAQNSAENAEAAAASAVNTANLWKKLTIGLCAGFVLLLVVAGFGIKLYFGQRDNVNNLRQQAIASCQIGNDRAKGTVTALDELVVLLEGPHPTAAVQKEAADYEAFVLQHNQQRDCTKAFSPSGG